LSINPARISGESRFAIPVYLKRHYWWAYVHPTAVRVFERQWLVNLILWGNFRRLRDAAIDLFGSPIRGRTLQVACVYGDLTQRLLDQHDADATLDVVDVLPVQLDNLARKLGSQPNVTLRQCDSSDLDMEDDSYDQVLVFFLLHEMPQETRKRTVAEALRVTKPGGRLVFVDYHGPHAGNPMGWFMRPVLKLLEPFALDLWRQEISSWLPAAIDVIQVQKRTWFGGLYQLIELRRA